MLCERVEENIISTTKLRAILRASQGRALHCIYRVSILETTMVTYFKSNVWSVDASESSSKRRSESDLRSELHTR